MKGVEFVRLSEPKVQYRKVVLRIKSDWLGTFNVKAIPVHHVFEVRNEPFLQPFRGLPRAEPLNIFVFRDILYQLPGFFQPRFPKASKE